MVAYKQSFAANSIIRRIVLHSSLPTLRMCLAFCHKLSTSTSPVTEPQPQSHKSTFLLADPGPVHRRCRRPGQHQAGLPPQQALHRERLDQQHHDRHDDDRGGHRHAVNEPGQHDTGVPGRDPEQAGHLCAQRGLEPGWGIRCVCVTARVLLPCQDPDLGCLPETGTVLRFGAEAVATSCHPSLTRHSQQNAVG